MVHLLRTQRVYVVGLRDHFHLWRLVMSGLIPIDRAPRRGLDTVPERDAWYLALRGGCAVQFATSTTFHPGHPFYSAVPLDSVQTRWNYDNQCLVPRCCS